MQQMTVTFFHAKLIRVKSKCVLTKQRKLMIKKDLHNEIQTGKIMGDDIK